MLKEFKTIDEQIDILKNRGLTIENVSFAKEKFAVHGGF